MRYIELSALRYQGTSGNASRKNELFLGDRGERNWSGRSIAEEEGEEIRVRERMATTESSCYGGRRSQ